MKYIITLFFTLMTLSLFAAESDSTSKRSLIIVPIGYYQPETSVALGAAGGYYLKSNDLKKISSISYSAIYTFNNQFIVGVTPKVFSKSKKYYFYGDFKARYYPDKFYGIGAKNIIDGYDYVSRHINLVLQPQRFLDRNWSVGVNYFMRYEIPDYKKDEMLLVRNDQRYTGWESFFIQGLGVVSTYDTRDNLFYPEKGFFGKVSCWFAPLFIGSDYNTYYTSFDIRNYIPLGKKHIFAYQFYSVFLTGDTPFQLMPSLGGSDKMRGFREGMFRNKNMLLLQGEYRYPIYKRLKGTVFGGIGHVYDDVIYTGEKLKVSYGAGLRYRLNDARVHLRFDFAFTNYNESNFYITATEAF